MKDVHDKEREIRSLKAKIEEALYFIENTDWSRDELVGKLTEILG